MIPFHSLTVCGCAKLPPIPGATRAQQREVRSRSATPSVRGDVPNLSFAA